MIIVNVSHCELADVGECSECREYPVYPDQTSGVLAGAGWAGLRHAMKMAAAAALPSTHLRCCVIGSGVKPVELPSFSSLYYAKLETIRNNEQEYR